MARLRRKYRRIKRKFRKLKRAVRRSGRRKPYKYRRSKRSFRSSYNRGYRYKSVNRYRAIIDYNGFTGMFYFNVGGSNNSSASGYSTITSLFATVFRGYKINKVKVEFIPFQSQAFRQWDSNGDLSTATAPQWYAYGGNYWDASARYPKNLSDAEQEGWLRRFNMLKPNKWVFKPTVWQHTLVGTRDFYQPLFSPYVPINNEANRAYMEHNGFLLYIPPWNDGWFTDTWPYSEMSFELKFTVYTTWYRPSATSPNS